MDANRIEDAKTLGRFLRESLKPAHRTKKGSPTDVSRVDACCWFVKQHGYAKRGEMRAFYAAFRGRNDESLNSMLCTSYGGVAVERDGTLQRSWFINNGNFYKHYGPAAPFFRPFAGTYELTPSGEKRAEAVEAKLLLQLLKDVPVFDEYPKIGLLYK